MKEKIRILHLEDLASDVEMVERVLKKAEILFEKVVVDEKAEFEAALHSFKPDIILSDHSLPTFDSIQALKMVQGSGRRIPFILVTGTTSEEFAVDVIKQGADDYILKDRLQRLPNAILNVLEKQRLEIERETFLDRVIADESLMREAEKLAHIGSFSRDLITGTSKWSDELFRVLGYQPGEVEPSLENFLKRLHPDDAPRVIQKINFAIDHLEALTLDFRILEKDGSVRYVFEKLIIKRDSDQRAILVAGFNQDVTQIKLAENAIRELNESLERKVKDRTVELHALNEELEAFNYSVSHDLRSPLRIIDGFVQILMKEMDERLTDDDRKTLNVIKDSANRMNQLIDSFLNLSRLGRAAMNCREINMNEQVRGVLEEIRTANSLIPAQVTINELPQATGDPELIRQVWQNLISNAIKYSRKKKEPVVEIGCKNMNGKPTYYVRDNGAGFDMKNAGRLFSAFQRLHKVSEFDGTGVGLALAKRIITKHNGDIWAEAAVDEGATFYFTLP